MPRSKEATVRCPYCPQALVVSRLHSHVSAMHYGKEQRAGRPIEKPPRKPSPSRTKDIPGQLHLFGEENVPTVPREDD